MLDLLNGLITKVIYNWQLFCLPLLHYTNCSQTTFDANNVFDPKLAAYLLQSDSENAEFDFHVLLEKYGIRRSSYLTEAISKPTGRVAKKICAAVDDLIRIIDVFGPMKAKLIESDCWTVFNRLEMPLVIVLSMMEYRGVYLSPTLLDQQAATVDLAKEKIATATYELAGTQFNLQSPDQVASILYDRLALPKPPNTPNNRHASTSEETLSKIRSTHPIIDLVLKFRTLSKISGTYVDGLRPYVMTQGPGGVIHALWNQAVVSTGRLSCSRPNLQSLPKGSVRSERIGPCGDLLNTDLSYFITPRSIFVGRPNYVLLSADYSQVLLEYQSNIH
jgi:DNA polymerase-1